MQYQNLRYNFFKWRYEADFIYKLMLSFLFACFTGMAAQLRIYLPFTPVPITAQVFAVLLSGVVLGSRYGMTSQAIYVGLGCLGLPWFANFRGGIEVLTGITGGYLIGFIIAAWIIGWLTESLVGARRLWYLTSLMLFGVVIIYTFGAFQLTLVLNLSFKDALIKGVLPFIPGDIIKSLAVAGLSTLILPKESYNGEIDVKGRKDLVIKSWILITFATALSLLALLFIYI